MLTSWILMILFTLIYVAKEVGKFLHKGRDYFLDYESWLHIATKVSFLLTSFHDNPFRWDERQITVANWQYHMNGVALFLTWLMQMLIIGR